MKHWKWCWLALFAWPWVTQAANPPRLDSLLAILHTGEEDTSKVLTMIRTGRLYFYNQPDSCHYYFDRALHLAEKFHYDYGIAFACHNFGDYHSFKGEYATSLEYYLRSRQLYEDLGKESMISSIQNNMGLVYMAIGDHEEARTHFEKALDAFVKEKKPDHESNVLNNLAMIHYDEKNYDEAERMYRRSLALREELNLYKGSVLHNLGELLVAKQQYDSAMVYFGLALAEKTAANRESSKATTYGMMGISYDALGNTAQAMQAFEAAYAVTQEFDLHAEWSKISTDYAALLARLGQYEKAYTIEREGRVLRDSLFNPEMLKDLSKLEVDYAMQKHEIEKQELVYKSQLAETQLKNSRWFIAFSLMVLMIVLGLLAWIYRLNVRKGQMNKDLNQLNAELEERVRQRTDSLQKKTEVLEQHAFDLSHRVRGPVASILGLAAMLEPSQEVDAENQRYVEGVKTKAQQLDQVLHEINDGLK